MRGNTSLAGWQVSPVQRLGRSRACERNHFPLHSQSESEVQAPAFATGSGDSDASLPLHLREYLEGYTLHA